MDPIEASGIRSACAASTKSPAWLRPADRTGVRTRRIETHQETPGRPVIPPGQGDVPGAPGKSTGDCVELMRVAGKDQGRPRVDSLRPAGVSSPKKAGESCFDVLVDPAGGAAAHHEYQQSQVNLP